MRDLNISMEKQRGTHFQQTERGLEIKVNSLETENRLKTMISQINNSMSWGNSILKVVFRDESFAEKYKSKIETFLKELLDKDENFIMNSQIYDNTEQEFSKLQRSFQAVTPSKSSTTTKISPDSVPIYSSKYEDVLHCDSPEPEEHETEEKNQMTCFNCLGNHHMKQCPEKVDRQRINANKKDILMENSSRYHIEEQKNSLKPGVLSSALREALGLKSDQLPQHIYKMRVVGYPPGWMAEAAFESSGLSLYDSQGQADFGEESMESNKDETKYDSSQLVDYPGFNTPVPSGFKDEWQSLGMVPIQPEHELSNMKTDNTANSTNLGKRKLTSTTEETKRTRNGSKSSDSSDQWSPEICSTPVKQDLTDNQNSTPLTKSSGISLSKTPGTPILPQGNLFQKLPEADKFAQGITEHLPFENLPDSTGKFEKMRGILSDVQKKLQNLKKGS